MMQWEDVPIAESWNEFAPMLPRYVKTVSKQRAYSKYLDVTCTFDIETSNNELEGFPYSFQTCFAGAVVLPRYLDDWLEVMEGLVDKYKVSAKRRLVCFVHNLGYEYTYLAQILNARWGQTSALYTKSRRPLYVRYANGIELRDSLKLFQKSLQRATVGCKHPKQAGDLDYTIYRTPDTPLNYDETGYCVCDVLGLWEAIERLKQERGYDAAHLPLSNTGIVIDALNKGVRGDAATRKAIKALELDKRCMRVAYKCMAGGDTHGARWYAGKTLTNCNSYDFKSAHPSQQLLWYFPYGAPIWLDESSQADLERLIKYNYGWCGKIFIHDFCVRPDCPDPTISRSRCEEIDGCLGYDNGRLLGAHGAIVWMDSNDYQRFRDAYDFKTVILIEGFCFGLKYLPDAFRKVIYDYFQIKESKKDSPDYMFAKICVNTIFGACAQKTIRDEYSADIDALHVDWSRLDWELNLEKKDEQAIAKSQQLKFPFLWGLWTSSLSRLMLWEMLKIVGWERVIYWDTDSCKYCGPKCAGIEAYNANIRKQCELRGVVVDTGKKRVYIGSAEDEHPAQEYGYKRFRFLHAKCYAVELQDGTIESTIAGVDKKLGAQALNGNIDNLVDGLVIAPAGGLTLTYHDAPITTRSDFARPMQTAGWVEMAPREYRVTDKPWDGLFEQVMLS